MKKSQTEINELLNELRSYDFMKGSLGCTIASACEVINDLRVDNILLRQYADRLEKRPMIGTSMSYTPTATSKSIATRRVGDCWGGGHYRASRGDRLHNGVDYLMPASSVVNSTASGIVSKLGTCYRGAEFRYVQITDLLGHHVRHFYVSPSVVVGEKINRGQPIGTSQDLQKRYPADKTHPIPIPNHVHLEVLHKDSPDGQKYFIDPDTYTFA